MYFACLKTTRPIVVVFDATVTHGPLEIMGDLIRLSPTVSSTGGDTGRVHKDLSSPKEGMANAGQKMDVKDVHGLYKHDEFNLYG